MPLFYFFFSKDYVVINIKLTLFFTINEIGTFLFEHFNTWNIFLIDNPCICSFNQIKLLFVHNNFTKKISVNILYYNYTLVRSFRAFLAKSII